MTASAAAFAVIAFAPASIAFQIHTKRAHKWRLQGVKPLFTSRR